MRVTLNVCRDISRSPWHRRTVPLESCREPVLFHTGATEAVPGGAGAAAAGYSLDYLYVGVAEDGTPTMLVRFAIDLAGQSSLLDGVRQATLLVDNLMYSDQEMTEGTGR